MKIKSEKLFIEPTVRSIAGGFILIFIAIDYYLDGEFHPIMFLVSFIGFNFFQSGFTGFCGLEKILKFLFHMRSEIDEIKKLGEEIGKSKSDHEYVQTLNLLEEAIVELDCNKNIRKVSDSFSKIMQCECVDQRTCTKCSCTESCLGQSFLKYIIEDEREHLLEKFKLLNQNKNMPLSVHFRITDFSGKEKTIEAKFLNITESSELPEEGCTKGILRDITDSLHQEMRILHLRMHDALTGLPNRILFTDRLEQSICSARRNESMLALMFIDIDSFKEFNEKCGHEMADKLLLAISQTLKETIRGSDTIARWGSDEFIILLNEFHSLSEIKKVASSLFQKIIAGVSLKMPFSEFHLSAGISIYPADALTSEHLFIQVNRALEKARMKKMNSFVFYGDVFNDRLDENGSDITSKLRNGILNDIIKVHYQPIVDAKTGRVVSVEAFARWLDDDYGWVNPSMFIQIAENLGIIHELGNKIFGLVFTHYLERSEYRNNISIAVNISSKQLMAPNFVNDFLDLVYRYGVQAENVTLEISEGIWMLGMGRARESMRTLSEFGFRFSIDDFGSGFSSISSLQELPIHEIKIDSLFIKNVHDVNGRLIIKSIIDMGHAMDLKIVCESVEDKETAEALIELGADFLQGNFFMSPREDIFQNIPSSLLLYQTSV